MNSLIAAIPGQWYLDPESKDVFQVVGVEDDDRSIDIQHVDGSLGQIPCDGWMAMRLELCDQPEDWVGPFDDLEADEIGMPETNGQSHRRELPMERALLDIEDRRVSPSNSPDE